MMRSVEGIPEIKAEKSFTGRGDRGHEAIVGKVQVRDNDLHRICSTYRVL